ncbi:tRNA lysidine(34) synthetase TilS [Nocardioides coralli]|uniref:tRNA lysidine(34) synthetase TilS n=1 Tax=Nocardioides coralli TaxID=2872154 RepID=UPI001CA3DF14|nr:tRNA lysidine(34) synthetase TilS [Nocardioides coralli]QZY29404.1 tRNA lysidine(34) synthetase TilS [Nocardioides coralli]
MSLDPAVAACRRGVRQALAALEPGDAVLVACSGGADSLALLAATVAEGHRQTLRVVGATVDHGLQAGSGELSERVVAQMVALGADETVGVKVHVEGGGRGPEAAAREARYAVLEEAAGRIGARRVLLGHTLDDQAETVLLGLTRGSGGRSLAGMRPAYGVFVRPLLGVTRAQTEAACVADGIAWWTDPHNSDPAFTRARVRQRVMPVLEKELGPGIAATLARTATQLQADVAALDALAEEHHLRLDDGGWFDTAGLAELPDAIRLRVLRLAALRAGAPGGDLTHGHLQGVDELVTSWRGQRWIGLPGPLHAVRQDGRLTFRRPDTAD